MIDIHVHFFPPGVFQAIWRYFETPGHGLWNIKYKLYGSQLIQALKEEGVKRFTTLVYAHKGGLAEYLNDFIKESAGRFPELIPFGTVFAGDGHCEKVARQIFEEYKFFGIKLHPFVSNENLDDSRFFPVYEIMQDLGKILVCHPSSVPVYQQTDGAIRLRNVLNQFPQLKVIVAHCGAFEYEDYHALAGDFEYLYFDTAFNCVHSEVLSNNCPGREFFLKHQDRILFGSDFPNIPHAYSKQIVALQKLNLGEAVERKIFNDNALNLLGLEES
jgi:predicted TIM-barrel fold metal-dependent hydrolase